MYFKDGSHEPIEYAYDGNGNIGKHLNKGINYMDLRGDSISVSQIQSLDKAIGTNFTQKIIDDLQAQTGLTISVNNNGIITYAKNANGNSLPTGSNTARFAISKALDHSDMITIVYGSRSGVDPQNNNTIRLGIRQIEGFVKGTVGMDSRTLGWGMTLMHELYHTKVGGNLKDNYGSGYLGDVVTQMNAIRSELNAQGGIYGQRLSYESILINGYIHAV